MNAFGLALIAGDWRLLLSSVFFGALLFVCLGMKLERVRRSRAKTRKSAHAEPDGWLPTPHDLRSGPYQGHPPANDAIDWALALSAVDCERFAGYHDRIDLLPRGTKEDRFVSRLARELGVATRDDWQRQCCWLRDGGHRRELELLKELISKSLGCGPLVGLIGDPDAFGEWLENFAETYGDRSELRRYQFALLMRDENRLRRMTGAARDASRLLMLYRIGIRLDYHDEKTARRLMSIVGEVMALRYRDWNSYAEDLLSTTTFVEGRPFEAELRCIVQRLHGKNMPWQRVPWQDEAHRTIDCPMSDG